MQYGQIVFLLFVVMVFYYAAMIFMDFQRQRPHRMPNRTAKKKRTLTYRKKHEASGR